MYATRRPADVSWFQDSPTVSLRLLSPFADPAGCVLDAGAGASHLAEGLLEQGWGHVTAVDLSEQALEVAGGRCADEGRISRVVADLLTWSPPRAYDAWHDRAVFHFLTDTGDREQYVAQARAALLPGGHLVLGTFALDGPDSCSGLTTARYDIAELSAALGAGFTLEHHEREQHVTPQGATQHFTWGVFRRD